VLKGEGYPPFNIHPDLYWPEIAGAATVDSSMNWAQVPKDDPLARVENNWTTPMFTDTWALKKKWYEAGYIVRDMPRIGEDRAGWAAGKAAIGNWLISPGGEFELESLANCEIAQKSLTDPFLTTASTTGAMVGVSRTTNSMETSVKWLELINTDPATYNLLCFGIEGRHWNWGNKDKLVIEQVVNSTYNPMSNWMFGNVFNSYYRNERQVGAWDACRKINDTAPRSTVLGFALERDSLKNEIAAVTAMLGEWTPYTAKGRAATELPKAVEQMNAAGATTILTEIQRQIDEWRQNG
jgi:putative aldouronate transport system substrate-binding protein